MTSQDIPTHHAASIRDLRHLRDDATPQSQFRLWEDPAKKLSCYYAPFDYVNAHARLILVGITPGRTQMNRALNAARLALSAGTSMSEAVRKVKREGSFSGAMRSNIVNTLNRLGYHTKLGVTCASQLWGTDDHLVHFCSLLKYPVFLAGNDYNGKPKAHKDVNLHKMLLEGFAADLKLLPRDAILLPLGETVLESIVALKSAGHVPQDLLSFEGKYVAPPHPSGANAESIALLLEPKYLSGAEYANRMYLEYMERKPWMRKSGGKPQAEEKYKAVRLSRWASMLFVRRAYGLS